MCIQREKGYTTEFGEPSDVGGERGDLVGGLEVPTDGVEGGAGLRELSCV